MVKKKMMFRCLALDLLELGTADISPPFFVTATQQTVQESINESRT